MPVTVRCENGHKLRAILSNLTEAGCAITTMDMPLALGRHLVLHPEGMEGLTGQVIWNEAGTIGFRFDRPLYGPVVEHLISRHPPY